MQMELRYYNSIKATHNISTLQMDYNGIRLCNYFNWNVIQLL